MPALSFSGYFNWFSTYLFVSLLIWTLIGFILSLKLTTELPIPLIYIQDNEEGTDMNEIPVQTEIRNGLGKNQNNIFTMNSYNIFFI